MLASFKITSILLLSFTLQSSWCSTNNRGTLSVAQSIGQLNDVAAYARTLDPGLKEQLFSILQACLFYKRFLEKIGADPNLEPTQLSSGHRKEWDKIHLLFIDLYRITYKAVEPIITQYNHNRKSKEEPMDPVSDSLELMELMFLKDVDVSEDAQDLDLIASYKKLLTTIEQHYIKPFNRYIDGGDWGAFKESVDIGRGGVYQAVIDFLKKVVEQITKKEKEDDAKICSDAA